MTHRLRLRLACLLLATASTLLQAQVTLLHEGFEGAGVPAGWSDVSINGAFEFGTPTTGPAAAHTGTGVMGVGLSANYLNNRQLRLRTPSVDFTGTTDASLTFQRYLNIEAGFDSTVVKVSTNGGSSFSNSIVVEWGDKGSGYGLRTIDLESYLGAGDRSQVVIEFYFSSDGSVRDVGWFVDEVTFSGTLADPSVLLYESFERDGVPAGWSDVSISGAFEFGTPTTGPAAAHNGTGVMGVGLSANYLDNQQLRLRTPSVDFTGTTDASLTFQRYINIEAGFDSTVVKVSTNGGSSFSNSIVVEWGDKGSGYGLRTIDLESYLGAGDRSQVVIEFYFSSDGSVTDVGWFVDEVRLSGTVVSTVFTAPADLCLNVGAQPGLGGGTPTGGVYSGSGVTDDGNGMTYCFDSVVAGVGIHTLTYTPAVGDPASDDVEVFALPGVTFTAPADLCVDAGVQAGLGGGAPTGGVYSGSGVSDDGNGMSYSFDPAAAGVGTHSLSYTYTDANGCTASANDGVEVFALPTVTFTAPADLCVDAGVQSGLGGGAPTGGVYSGSGVSDDGNGMSYSFDPAAAGVGTHSLSYSYTDANGCTASGSDDVEVFALPSVTFTAPADMATDAGVQTGLGGGTPTGGVYSGSGVSDDGNGMSYSFDPAAAGVGTHSLSYTFTDANGCTASASDDVEVFIPRDFGDAPDPLYPTLQASNGAFHAGVGPQLGSLRDTETDGQANAAADGDDTDGSDDEDGVSFLTAFLAPGATGAVDVVVSAPCRLDAWIDFNRDGSWSAAEQIFQDVSVTGSVELRFPVPNSLTPGDSFARFRVSSAGSLQPTGFASDGEVEDYQVVLDNDTDRDGIRDGAEAGFGTSPVSRDSDGDGIEDGVEVLLGTDPAIPDVFSDADRDGIPDSFDMAPDDPDADGDGIADGFGLVSPTFSFGNVNGDGVIDFSDVAAINRYVLGGGPPLPVYDADINRDGLIDRADVMELLYFLRGLNAFIPRL